MPMAQKKNGLLRATAIRVTPKTLVRHCPLLKNDKDSKRKERNGEKLFLFFD
jgi:hypothetical protein